MRLSRPTRSKTPWSTIRYTPSKAKTESRSVVDFDRSGISRYIQLSTLFRRRIETGVWKLGQQIPTVDALSTEFSVARATVRQALSILERDGLIVRRRAKGTFVTFRPQEALWCQIGTNWSGLLNAREDARIEILARDYTEELTGLIHDIGTHAPSYWHLRRRHWREEQPFLFAEVYIDRRLENRIPEEALTSKTSMRLVSDVAGVEVVQARQGSRSRHVDVAAHAMVSRGRCRSGQSAGAYRSSKQVACQNGP